MTNWTEREPLKPCCEDSAVVDLKGFEYLEISGEEDIFINKMLEHRKTALDGFHRLASISQKA
jgi:hypothetical protein